MIWRFDLPLESERLLLREHRATDLDDLVLFHGDEEVTRYIPWPVRDREATRVALEVKIARTIAATSTDWIVLAIEERATRAVIGEALLKREGDDAAEVGYVIRRDRWGRGLASEAVSALIDAAVARFGIRHLSAVVEPANTASATLLTRLGFERAPRLDNEEVIGFERSV